MFAVRSEGKLASPDHPQSWIRKRYTSFDGLRGLAVLLVFINHYGQISLPRSLAMTCWWGVDLFFVLSGFLITGILYDSKGSAGYFRNFYVRRTLRIFPLYYGVLLLSLILIPILHLIYQPRFWTNFFYISNLARLHPLVANPTYLGFRYRPHTALTFGHLWSLCVEEQFYVVWPLIMWLLPDRKAMMRFAIGAVLVTLSLRVGLFLHNPAEAARTHYLYFFTPTRCDGLFIGAWFALWLRGVRLRRIYLRRLAFGLILPSVAILVLGEIVWGRAWAFDEGNPLLCTYGYTLIDLACAGLLLLSLDEENRLSRLLRIRWLAFLGTISYGFYLIHGIPWDLFDQLHLAHQSTRFFGSITIVLGFVSCVTAAWISYRFYEAPFLRLKDKLAPPVGHASTPRG